MKPKVDSLIEYKNVKNNDKKDLINKQGDK